MAAQTIATSNLAASVVTLNLTSPSTGTGFFTLLAGGGATCGTAVQTAAGEDSSGTVVIHGSLALTANTTGFYTVANLSDSMAYTVCFTPDGSTAPVSTGFTTAAAVSLTGDSWQAVGSPGFSAASAYSIPLSDLSEQFKQRRGGRGEV